MKRIIVTLLILSKIVVSWAQDTKMYLTPRFTLSQAIEYASSSSPSAKMAELSFMSVYWSYRSHKAELLPSINLGGDLGNYNRSVVEARDSETGVINYVSNNTLSNSLSLSVDQNIALTGGTVSLVSSLARLDQFTYDNITYNSVPLSISYIQPLRAFNTLKWQKKTMPLEYERAKRNYLGSMENIAIQTTNYFFAILLAQTTLKNTEENYADTKRMYDIAQKRFAIGTITKSELLQLELTMLNANMAIRDSEIAVGVAKFDLKSYLGITYSVDIELIVPSSIPNILLEYDFVLGKAIENSAHTKTQELTELEAEKSVAQAKALRGIQMQLNANLGFSQTANNLSGAYADPRDREVVGLTLSMPLFDWGMNKGRVRMSEAELDLVMTEIEQEEIRFRQDIMIKVIEFNNQIEQCSVSQKAMKIASERYQIMVDRFENGGITVDNLNTAQKEMDSASHTYINQLRVFWSAYYDIQKLSLYDYINEQDINAEFDNIIESQL